MEYLRTFNYFYHQLLKKSDSKSKNSSPMYIYIYEYVYMYILVPKYKPRHHKKLLWMYLEQPHLMFSWDHFGWNWDTHSIFPIKCIYIYIYWNKWKATSVIYLHISKITYSYWGTMDRSLCGYEPGQPWSAPLFHFEFHPSYLHPSWTPPVFMTRWRALIVTTIQAE